MLELRPYKASDLSKIKPRAYEKELCQYISVEMYAKLYEFGPSFTGYVDDVPVGAAGLVPLWPGVSEAWMYLSDWVTEHHIIFAIAVKKKYYEIIKEHKLWRIQAPIEAELEENLKLAYFLGMLAEGTLKKFGPTGKDFIMMALVK